MQEPPHGDSASGAGVHILGVGSTAFGPQAVGSFRSLLAEAVETALTDAGIQAAAVDEVHHANFTGALTDAQNHQAPLVADLVGGDVPAIRHENACASGGFAMWSAVRAIRSGAAEIVLVTGVEHLSPLSTGEVTTALAMAADELYEVRNGLTFPGAYALMARSYISAFDPPEPRKALSSIAVKNHAHASVNPLAHFQSTVDLQTAMEAPMVADPLNLYDSCPISDGAAAVVLAATSALPAGAAEAADVRIRGVGAASDHLALQTRSCIHATVATARAAGRAFTDAALTPEDVDIAEVHDCFTIAEVLALEALGFYEPGGALGAADRGETAAGGRLPTNLSGGLKAKGHPVGATGVSQIAELTKLLRGDHPAAADIETPAVGVAHNAGGTVATAVVHLLEVADHG
jgi:acetyl-CoA C-acetyltransferase